VLGFNLVVLGVYRFKETTKEEFVTNAVHVEMQRHHFYNDCHVIKVTNAIATYQMKHKIIDLDMVYSFHFI
jgi:hypothetical protein